jgi:SAM-dependent methyltransferase
MPFYSAAIIIIAMNEKEHWQQVYSTRLADQHGWYTPHLKISLGYIADLKLSPGDPIIDIGGGASTLVDDLLDAGHKEISVLDLSEQALSSVKQRLGDRADQVSWLQGDVTEVELPSDHFALWHDRAVFHFLIEADQQRKYRDKLLSSLRVGGYLVIGTFDLDAPPRCSGLPVERYSVELLSTMFGAEFNLEHHQKQVHRTPSGMEQAYLYCLFQRTV